MAARRAKEEATGKKTPGRKPKPPEPGPRKKDQVNLTDEESRIMPTGGGSFEQAYNAQALVDTATHLILDGHVTQAPNDKQQLVPALEHLDELPEALGAAERLLADNGYFSEPNVEAATDWEIEPLIALGRQAHNVPLAERLVPPEQGEPPEEATPLEQMAYRLKTPEGRASYAQRKSTVETVFGMIKSAMGFRHFLLRGYEIREGQWRVDAREHRLQPQAALPSGEGGLRGDRLPTARSSFATKLRRVLPCASSSSIKYPAVHPHDRQVRQAPRAR